MKSPVGNPAHPMWPENRVVLWGIREERTHTYETTPRIVDRGIVGQNLKFDLLYALKHRVITPMELVECPIWDTQLAEYLLSGQQALYASLDSLALRYGGEVKDSAVSEFFKAGKGADEVPMSLLKPYLVGDLENTALIYEKQKALVVKYGMEKLVVSQMEALRATTLMEFYGMKVDSGYIDKRIVELTEQCTKLELKIETLVMSSPRTLPVDWSWSSGKDVSLYFFGGTYKVKEKVEVGVYKTTGKPKFRIEERVIEVPMTFEPAAYGAERTAHGWYTVDEKVLKNIKHPMAEAILQLRTLNKQKTTYFEGMRDLTFPSGFIHPSLNHTATKTGRLSCNKPNIQNQTDEGGIKRAYVSRWGDEGVLVEFDYSQLEMVALAYLSGDVRLLADIGGGLDMHTELYRDMHGRAPTKEERKWFKRLSFGLVYGAGPYTLSENAGCTVAEAKKFIKVFYGRYPQVKEWHDENIENATLLRRVTTEHDVVSKMPVGKYVMHTETGRRYVFREYFNDKRKSMSFSPTELKNYPVQGFATGDVVPHMVGYVVTSLTKSKELQGKALPIMTVHDSMLFDVRKEVLDLFLKKCYNVLRNTTSIVQKHFGLVLGITLDVGCKVGSNWQDMEEVDCSTL